MESVPRIAIVEPNTLAVLGLTGLLQSAIPCIEVDTFASFVELEANEPERYFHFFVNMNIVMEHRSFFCSCYSKTIVLSQSPEPFVLSDGFHNICVCQPEKQLLRSFLMLESHAHAGGKNLPPIHVQRESALSPREIEVMTLIVQGYLNKEIAEKLNIGITTVITHRKNVMSKLGMKSVSALTVYAVVHGYVDISVI